MNLGMKVVVWFSDGMGPGCGEATRNVTYIRFVDGELTLASSIHSAQRTYLWGCVEDFEAVEEDVVAEHF